MDFDCNDKCSVFQLVTFFLGLIFTAMAKGLRDQDLRRKRPEEADPATEVAFALMVFMATLFFIKFLVDLIFVFAVYNVSFNDFSESITLIIYYAYKFHKFVWFSIEFEWIEPTLTLTFNFINFPYNFYHYIYPTAVNLFSIMYFVLKPKPEICGDKLSHFRI